jgi:hypothetical protein
MDDIGSDRFRQAIMMPRNAPGAPKQVGRDRLGPTEQASDRVDPNAILFPDWVREGLSFEPVRRGREFDVDLMSGGGQGFGEVLHVDRVTTDVVRRVERRGH